MRKEIAMTKIQHRPLGSSLALVALGAATPAALRCLFSLVSFTWRRFLRPSKKLTGYGQWAVVSGATDGIGREYCERFAEQGMRPTFESKCPCLCVKHGTRSCKHAGSK